MENPGNQSEEATGAVEDPPPPTTSTQEQSTSESSSQPQQQQERRLPPPLSPLTGSYLLIVVGEPHSERHKEIILQKIAKAFLSWDVSECHVSLEKELQVITSQSPEGEEARYGERLIQYATENLVTEILIHPQLNTLHQCLKNLLSSFTKHRLIIHAGYTFAGNGSWILQDGTLSISDLVEALHEPDVLRVLRAYENSVSIDIHCAPEGDWTTERFQKEPVSKLCSIRINPGDVMTAGNPAISTFIDYLSPFLEPANIQQLLQPTDVVGNIRFTHPTLYVFPGGQGDAALFGINGFNMLIDGGFARKACFWDFARHLDRLDAVLLTRLNNSTVNGISAVLQRKKLSHVYPQIGHFFCNLQDRKIALSPDGDKDKDSLIVNLAEEGQEIVANLRHIALKPHPCYRDGNQVDPVNLYHKVGHGKLDMYVISPARDSLAVKEFLAKWSSNDSHLFSNTGKKIPGKSFEFPLQNLVSICALLVWQPANPNDTITRILFPGSTPQHKIFEGLEKLRHLEFLKHSVCSAKSISPSVSTTTVQRSFSKARQQKPLDNKQNEAKIISKSQLKPVKPKMEKVPLKESKSKLDNKLADERNELDNVEEPLKKLDNRMLSKDEQIENIKKEIQKIEQAENEEHKKKIIHRSKYDMRNVKSKVDSRAPSKSIDRKKAPEKKLDGEASPPTTPKKGLANGTATKTEKAKIGIKQTKAPSPASTPAKSAKEANNRKVVEARVTKRSLSKSVTRKKEETPTPIPYTTAKVERKPISRRPKAPLSPVKTLTGKSAKTEPESIPKKVKKKTEIDSSIIKGASQIIGRDLQKDAETEKTDVEEGKVEIKKLEEEIIENKETDVKAVKIELQSAQTEKRNVEEDEEEVEEEEEEEEEEEYLIITKEEYGEESAKEDESGKENEEELQTKDETEGEGEMKKLLREEEESEKKREVNEAIDLKFENESQKQEIKKEETEIKTKGKILDEENKEDEKMKIIELKKEESLRDKILEGREFEVQKMMEMDEGIDLKEPVSKEHKEGESLPEEKISNTLETSATTAPTLPEDERIEELVEEEKDQPEDVKEVIEEKYIQEKTKEEKQEEAIEKQEQKIPKIIDVEVSPVPIQITQRKHPRDVVKTPDEVAELPMHEEVDPRLYSSGDFTKELQRKSEEEKHDKPDFKAMVKGEANFLDEEDISESEDSKKAPEQPEKEKNQIEDSVITKYLNIIDELEKSGTELKKDSTEPESSPKIAFVKDNKIDEDKTEKCGFEKPENARTDGIKRSSLQLEKIDVERSLGKSSPREIEKIIIEKTTSEILSKEKSEIIKPQELKKEPSRTSTSVDIVKDSLEKSTLQDLTTELSAKSTPRTLYKETSGKSSPQALVPEDSGKNSSQELIKDISVLSTPQEFVNEISIKNSSEDLVKEMPGKSASLKSEHSKDTYETFSPQGMERDISGKSSPSGHGISTSGKITPQNIKNQISVEYTPVHGLEKKISTETFSQDIEAEIWRNSTLDSKIMDPEVFSEPARHALEKTSKEDIKTENFPISGKSTPQDFQKCTLDESISQKIEKSLIKDLEKDISREPIPGDLVKEISDKFTFEEPYKDVSEEFTSQTVEKEISGRSIPRSSERKISGEFPSQNYEEQQISDRSSAPDLEPKTSEKTASLEHEKDASNKSIQKDLDISEKSIPKDSDKNISKEPTSEDLLKETSDKSTPQKLSAEIARESAPNDLAKEISEKLTSSKSEKDISETSTPNNLSKDVSREPTPHELSKDVSREPTPHELSKDVSREPTPHELSKDISREPTPHELSKDVSREPTPHELSKDVSREPTPHERSKDVSKEPTPHERSKDISREPTPHEPSKDVSREPTPHELSKDVSREPTPHELSKDISREPTPHELSKDISREPTPHEPSEDVSREPTPHEPSKDVSREPTPHELSKDVSREPTPHELSKDVSREPTPHELSKGVSREPTPHELSNDVSREPTSQSILKMPSSSLHFEEPNSGKFILQELDKNIPDRAVVHNLDNEEFQISTQSHCEILAQELTKQISDKTTPTTLEKTVSGKSIPEKQILETDTLSLLDKESSRKSSTKDFEKFYNLDEENNVSRKNSPIEAEKSVSGRITPCDLDSIRITFQTVTENANSYEDEKTTSGKSSRRESFTEHSNRYSPVPSSPRTSQDLGSIKSTSTNVVGDISLPDNDSAMSEKINEDFIEKGKVEGKEKDKSEKINPQEVIKPSFGKTSPMENVAFLKENLEKSEGKILPTEKVVKKTFAVESSVSDSVSSGPGEKDVSGKSTPFSTDKEISGKISPPVGGKVTSDSFSLALAEKGTSGTYSLEKENSEKISSPSPVDISPLSLDEIKEDPNEKADGEKKVSDQQKEGRKSMTEIHELVKSQLERVKYEGRLSGTSTPDESQYEKSETSLPNGVESEDEPEKGILESEKQEKESQILDISSGEEEELKALGDDEDSEPEIRKDDLERGIILSKEIAKDEKEDINKLVKISAGLEVEEEQDSDYKTSVRRMLVTASSEDGGTETEICIKSAAKVEKEDEEDAEKCESSEEGIYSNLILQARQEYNAQRSRKTSCNSSEGVEDAEESIKLREKDVKEKEEDEKDDENEELGTLLKQARQELAYLRSKNREMSENELINSEKKLERGKTTTTSETRRTDDDTVTVTTVLTEEREEQEDGSVKVTITKETTTEGGRDEGTVVIVNTNIVRKEDKKLDEEESSSQMNLSGDRQSGTILSREDSEKKTSQEEVMETSRRTSASSIISQEDLVSRKDSAKIEDFHQSSTEMSPLKTTYITSHGDSESLMTSSFYGNLPTEDEMIGRSEHLREFRKGRGYESFTEVGPNGERTERTYFYGSDGDPGTGRERSRFVKAYYTDEGQQKDGEQSRFVHKYYTPGIPEEESVERTRFVQRFYAEEASQPEPEVKYTFVETHSEEPTERMDFAKAIDEHISTRGEYLGKEFNEDVIKFGNGKLKREAEGEGSDSEPKEEEEKKKDLIEGWGKPLGLPLPPKNVNKTYAFSGQNISTTSTLSTPTDNSDSVSNWGHPMNLPSPAPPPAMNGIVDTLPERTANSSKDTPKKEKKIQPKKNISGDNKSSGTNTPNRRSESPVKQFERRTPSTGRSSKPSSSSYVYLDLTYVPHHGNSYYSNVEFFKKVRARYYVFSGTEPSKEVYNALLEAKQTWEDKKLEVTIIPTYDTDVLGYWVAENEEILAKHKIDLSPSASRCTINLQDHETSCSAYRLEF